jgi:hypothetical protein
MRTQASVVRLSTLLVAAVVLGASAACRSITDAPCPAEVITADIIGSNSLIANETTASSATVTRPGGILPTNVWVPAITIQPADIQFSGTGSGTVALAVAINGVVAMLGTLTITDGGVGGLSPTTFGVGQYPRVEAQAIIDALPEAQRTVLNLQDVVNLTETQIRDAVSAAVRGTSFDVVILTHTTDSLFGAVAVERLTFQLGC